MIMHGCILHTTVPSLNCELLDHCAYNSDLAQSDLHVFWKKHLACMMSDKKDLEIEVTAWFYT